MKGITLLALSIFSTAFLSFTPINKKYIVIDAGHGGNDFGATYGEILEKNIALSVAKEIRKINESQNQYEVILTRDSDSYPTLAERTDLINKLNPEMVISLHVNSSPEKERSDNGFEVYVQNSDVSKELAGKIYKKFNARKISESNLHMLRETKAPAVLVELGFINNSDNRNYITSEKGQKEIAQKFVEIINEY
ncbi:MULTISPECIES: N-acetylmuramoyl-L-alanine amidase family protein [Chryseobacterium]|uniref:N-acetylmuramoyl-L-alanine amidase n=1 Tax=Chryseobacterium cucumeris TaxID=1813611 RepID=A0ABX9X5N9_9FLAO|nr:MULTISPECIES: N-acetylmuramoyl-L-alanine amidase [Chryseobacterium]KYH05402.1 N-acetylmuramoyl-L-alanine amidase [Chryseobacterium cucumeris]MDH5031948.1 N-acetylmuramoyl-L-alanine amidase [Chryseobacterium cucumeris]QWT85615.1 N-acetylmuramoyl-L-alanine amidase [Chryseobacterium sp. PCH239]RKE82969.1 N-acetylmuramoyl-L-alanine amidase [Chryseobacterium sp. AG363]ROH90225.1 N-acetylmuramoyl-L-alanine amidase [Chryseobacterium cucumeris]